MWSLFQLLFSRNRPTGPIQSCSRNVCPWLDGMSPSHAILPGEQRRSQGIKAVSHCGISTLKNCTSKKSKKSCNLSKKKTLSNCSYQKYWEIMIKKNSSDSSDSSESSEKNHATSFSLLSQYFWKVQLGTFDTFDNRCDVLGAAFCDSCDVF